VSRADSTSVQRLGSERHGPTSDYRTGTDRSTLHPEAGAQEDLPDARQEDRISSARPRFYRVALIMVVARQLNHGSRVTPRLARTTGNSLWFRLFLECVSGEEGGRCRRHRK
jgi:hypothetical protein